jgi:NAD(P)-dependent dehydrogenase (short-subunit alcohol dehydrogenase family)
VSFKNTVALVTRAGSGIGLAKARAFAEAGAAVALADVDEQAVYSAAALVSTGHQAIAVRCNVAASAVWMQRSTMLACSVRSQTSPMPVVKSSTASSRSI